MDAVEEVCEYRSDAIPVASRAMRSRTLVRLFSHVVSMSISPQTSHKTIYLVPSACQELLLSTSPPTVYGVYSLKMYRADSILYLKHF